MTSAAELAAQATEEILGGLETADRGVVVDSPPGAGKSTLVVRAAAGLADAGEPVMVVAQTNEQVDDLTDRLAPDRPGAADRPPGRQRLHPLRPRSPAPERDRSPRSVADLAGCPVMIGTAHKWATVRRRVLAVGDRGRGLPDALGPAATHRRAGSSRALFVGDPGQLDPFSAVQTDRWTGLTWDPMQSAVAVLLRHNPDIAVRTAAGVLAAARHPPPAGVGGVLPVHRVPLRHRAASSGG